MSDPLSDLYLGTCHWSTVMFVDPVVIECASSITATVPAIEAYGYVALVHGLLYGLSVDVCYRIESPEHRSVTYYSLR